MSRELPSGTVTFLFTDVEGSTKLLHELGGERYAEALAEHRRILREAFSRHGGAEVDTQGDAFFVAFPTAPGALEAASEALKGLARGPIRVRIGIHTGTPLLDAEGYVGIDVHRAARIAAVGHGGQVLLSASTAALLGSDRLRDLGKHRLKDLAAPERIYQLGDEQFPRLTSLHRTNLPVPPTSFLGRERELTALRDLLAQDDTRLVTLTGPGGTGKTRLGLQAAAEIGDRYPDGVFWVPLAPLREPRLVLETAAQTLDAKNGLEDHIGDKSLLLLFDNFEHVIDAAPDLSDLLIACPNLQLLVTSRELLRVPGEQAYPVPPLEPEDGMDLFVARARAARPSFEPSGAVPELCARLDNLPLALELAAARIRIFSPDQLLRRLSKRLDVLKAGRGVDPRQQTLRATIEWSHELLDDDEQQLFARLGVFSGGCTLDAAEAICDADPDTLQSLIDKSLVHLRDGDRFSMLETIRVYAGERLEESGEGDELRRRHAAQFVALAEEAEPHALHQSGEWLDRLERDHDNLRAALDWLETSGETELALRLAGAVGPLWAWREHQVEGRRRLARLLAADERPTSARAKALTIAADLAVDNADAANARRLHEEALALHRQHGDALRIALSIYGLGHVCMWEDDWEGAQKLFEQSLRLFEELGDEHYALESGRKRAWTFDRRGDRKRARALHEENLARARAAGNEYMVGTTLGTLSGLALQEGRVDDALPMLREASRIHVEFGDHWGRMLDLRRFARLLSAKGRAESAARVLGCAEAVHEQTGVAMEPWIAAMTEASMTAIRGQLDEPAIAQAMQEGRTLSTDEALALALESAD